MRKKKQHPAWRRYTWMKQAVYNPNSPDYARIGGQGIGIAWNSSKEFCKWVDDNIGPPPQGNASRLVRINPNRDFAPGNLKWVSPDEFVRYQNCAYMVRYRGKTQHLKAWSDELGIAYSTIAWRHRQQWPDRELFLPPGTRKVKNAKGKKQTISR